MPPNHIADLTNRAVIRDICRRYGFTFSKRLGQNFLINPSVCPRMAQAAVGGKDWGVLEIGPGIGTLSRALCSAAGRVVAIEIDRRLGPVLQETMAGYENFVLLQGDALKMDLAAVLRAQIGERPAAVCANLPYQVTTPLLMKLLEARLPVGNITVMVQKEAAQRLCAPPGTRQAGAVSYAVAYYAQAERLFTVQPGSFMPQPDVMSTVIRLLPRDHPPVAVPKEEEASFFRLIRAAFSQRRKIATNGISDGLHLPKQQVSAALCDAGLPEQARPEQLTLEDFCTLHKALQNRLATEKSSMSLSV